MNLPAYPRYKASGVAWLGDVPEGWEVLPLRRVVTEVKTGTTPPGAEEYYFNDNGLSWHTPSDFSNEIRLGRATRRLSTQGMEYTRQYPKQTVMIVGIGATMGKVGITEDKASCNQQINAICFGEKILPIFAVYSLSTLREYLFSCGKFTTLPILNQEETKNITICIPPLHEQAAIANFLDRETAKLDALIKKQHLMLDLLKEKRTAIISHAVTKGLNPNAKLKNSGVAWLGQVPEGWEVKKLSWYFSYTKGKQAIMLTKEYVAENIGNFAVYSGQTENDGLMGEIDSYEYDFNASVIFVTTVGAKAMTTRLLSGKFSLSQNCALIIPKSQIVDAAYYEKALTVLFLYERASISLIMQPSLRFEDLNKFYIPLPPLPAQQAIAAYLDRETARIDSLSARIQDMIGKLQEYRTALITAAVTGKVDVRGV